NGNSATGIPLQERDAGQFFRRGLPPFAINQNLAQRNVLRRAGGGRAQEHCRRDEESLHRCRLRYLSDFFSTSSRHSQRSESGRIAPPCLPLWPPSPNSNL